MSDRWDKLTMPGAVVVAASAIATAIYARPVEKPENERMAKLETQMAHVATKSDIVGLATKLESFQSERDRLGRVEAAILGLTAVQDSHTRAIKALEDKKP